MDRARAFERNRERMIAFVAARLVDASDSSALAMIRRWLMRYDVPANHIQMVDAATEALRRRLVEKIKLLDSRVHILHDRVTALEEASETQANQLATLQGQLQQLNQKVNSYHP